MKYAFNTFSCPDLELPAVLALAKECGYDGIEPRSGSKHHHGIELSTSGAERKEIRQVVSDSGVALACLACGCHYVNPSTTEQQIAETLSYIDLAAEIGATRLRVFGGNIPADVSREQASDLVVAALTSIADYAHDRRVVVCLETHDSWAGPRHVRELMLRVNHAAIGVTWDVMHPVREAGLTMDQAYHALEPWIKHVHVHDGSKQPDRLGFKPMGEGDLDHRRVLELLWKHAYDGFLSGEWIGWDAPAHYLPWELATLKQYEHDLTAE